MTYTIKAIPTTYAGINFRSRLEAKWAAFFDLAGFEWEYEPFDLDGWTPDFLLRLKLCNVLCEVKPFDLVTFMDDLIEQYNKTGNASFRIIEYDKATKHSRRNQVCYLGTQPLLDRQFMPIGLILDPPIFATYSHDAMIDAAYVENSDAMWREAGNVVQWIPSDSGYIPRREISITEMIQNGLRMAKERKAAA